MTSHSDKFLLVLMHRSVDRFGISVGHGKDLVRRLLPQFQFYSMKRIIIDCTEISIEVPVTGMVRLQTP